VKNYGEKSERAKAESLEVDNRGEYTSAEFKAYSIGEAIEHQLSIAGRSKQNRVAERMNHTYRACTLYEVTG